MKAVECDDGIVITNGFRTVGTMEKTKQKVLITDNEATLITGISGFVGSHLVDFLKTNPNIKIHGIVRWRSDVQNLEEVDNVKLHYGDLNDMSSLRTILESVRPAIIFHLAAQSYVDFSFKAPADTLKTNVVGTCNLLEAIKELKLGEGYDPIIHVCSSSEVYGQVMDNELPITEYNQFRPASPYAVSKCGEDLLALQYHLSWGLKTIRTRSFTHTGPRRGDVFALSSFAKQIALIENKKQDPVIKVGNLESVRTICDVRDVVKAYWLLVNKCTPGEVYNVGGLDHMTIGEALQKLLSFTSVKISVKQDPDRMRPSDVTMQIPDTNKFRDKTGWMQEYSIDQTLKDMLDYWREKVS